MSSKYKNSSSEDFTRIKPKTYHRARRNIQHISLDAFQSHSKNYFRTPSMKRSSIRTLNLINSSKTPKMISFMKFPKDSKKSLQMKKNILKINEVKILNLELPFIDKSQAFTSSFNIFKKTYSESKLK